MENENVKSEEIKNESTSENQKETGEKSQREKNNNRYIMIEVNDHAFGQSMELCLKGIRPIEAIGYLTVALEQAKKEVETQSVDPRLGGGLMGGILGDILGMSDRKRNSISPLEDLLNALEKRKRRENNTEQNNNSK